MATAELQNLGICCATAIGRICWVNPDTLSIETRLEALDTNNGEQEPEESNKK